MELHGVAGALRTAELLALSVRPNSIELHGAAGALCTAELHETQ